MSLLNAWFLFLFISRLWALRTFPLQFSMKRVGLKLKRLIYWLIR